MLYRSCPTILWYHTRVHVQEGTNTRYDLLRDQLTKASTDSNVLRQALSEGRAVVEGECALVEGLAGYRVLVTVRHDLSRSSVRHCHSMDTVAS